MGYNETPTERTPMFDLKIFNKKPNNLQDAIDAASAELLKTPIVSPEYNVLLDHLSKLTKLNESNSPKPVSRDTLVLAATNLAGIVLILTHERAHVVTSKALGFVLKSR